MVDARFDKTLIAPDGKFNLSVDIRVERGDFLTIYGPSGAGKTSVLRVIAGLLKPDIGRICVDDIMWLDSSIKLNLKPNKRSVGLVFQDYALFPNLTVRQNIHYGLKATYDKSYVEDVINLLELKDLIARTPATLSGGQSQRVALARTLVTKPKILMLDEPLAALDVNMRHRIQDHLLEAHKRYNLTIIIISHDIGEIFKLSNKVLKIESGRITKTGSPAEIFFDKEVTGNFQFTGEVLNISKEDVVYVITVVIGQHMVKVVAEENTASPLSIGDKVLLTSQAFNPIIQKLV